MPDDPSVYGSYLNFFLPKSAQVGGPSVVPTPGLFDMLSGMGLGGAGSANQPGTPADQQKKQQQNLAMAQQGLKMLQPQQTAPTPPPIPVSAAPPLQAPAPPPSQITGDPVTPPLSYGGLPPTNYGGLPGANAYAQRRAMPMPNPYPFGGGGGYGR